MTDKEKQRELIVEIMKADEQSGTYPAMKQTAVDYIRQHFIMDEEFEELFKEAKEMEKEQIKNAFIEGKWDDYGTDSNEYYKKNYEEL